MLQRSGKACYLYTCLGRIDADRISGDSLYIAKNHIPAVRFSIRTVRMNIFMCNESFYVTDVPNVHMHSHRPNIILIVQWFVASVFKHIRRR
jgi:hypothetical protein